MSPQIQSEIIISTPFIKKNTYTEAQKRANIKWRLNHRDNMRANYKKWYEINRERDVERLKLLHKTTYYFKKEFRRLSDIMI